MGETYLYQMGGTGISSNSGGPDGFEFDGVLGAGQYVLRISSSGSEDGGFMSSFKNNLVTNFDLKANFSPIIIGKDEGGNPLRDGSYIDLGTLHKEQTFDFSEYVQEGAYYGDVSDGVSFTLLENQNVTFTVDGLNRGYWEILDTPTQNFEQKSNGQFSYNLEPGQYNINIVGGNGGSLYNLNISSDNANPVINSIYNPVERTYVDVTNNTNPSFETGSKISGIFINTSEEVALTETGIDLLDSNGNILESFNSKSTNWTLQPSGLPEMGIVLNPTYKFTSNDNLELKIQTNSLVDLTGKALSTAASKTIPITKAENVVINLNDSQPNYHSGSSEHPTMMGMPI